MSYRKKRNLIIAAVISILILPLCLLSLKMEQNLALKEKQKRDKAQRRPAVQDTSYIMMSE